MPIYPWGGPWGASKPDEFLNMDVQETRELLREAQRLCQNVNLEDTVKEIADRIMQTVTDATEEVGRRCPAVEIELYFLGNSLVQEDDLFPVVPEFNEVHFRTQDLKSRVAFRNLLRRKIAYYTDYNGTLNAWMQLFKEFCIPLFYHLPDPFLRPLFRDAPDDIPPPPPFDIDYVDAVEDFHLMLTRSVFYSMYDERAKQYSIFSESRNEISKNMYALSPDPKDTVFPNDERMQKYTPREIVPTYLKNTYFHSFFALTKVPFDIPRSARFEHSIVTGGSGHGKTQLLQTLILDDLHQAKPPSLVVVDSQGQMLDNIARLQLFNDRDIIILDPRDNPALNVFDINQQRLRRYGQEQREQVLNHTLETFSYLFNSIIGADLTVKQSTLFNYLIYLMLAMPESMGRNATLLDLMKLMDDPEPYRSAIEALDPIPRDFFLKDFSATHYKQTKEQIRYRLQAIIGNPTLARLFLAPHNTVDFFDEMNKGSVILIDTNKAFLGAKNSSYLGRIAISLILQAILERGATTDFKHPVHLYVDEAGEYFDKSIDTFLTEARKQYAGITLAHQYLGQMTNELRASVAANTSIKFAGGLSSQDARALAADMRTDTDFILNQPKLTFACYIRGHASSAVALHVKPGTLENEPRMSDEDYQALRMRNRERVTSPSTELPQIPLPAEQGTDPDRPTTDW